MVATIAWRIFRPFVFPATNKRRLNMQAFGPGCVSHSYGSRWSKRLLRPAPKSRNIAP